MNKKQLAKLLIKHPEIKALYESREFDASTINKIVAEEIMREDEDEEGEGRVSKADKQARATLDAVEDSDLEPINCEKDDINCLRKEIEAATTMKELEELGVEVDPRNPKHKGLIKALKVAKGRIEGSGSEAPPAEEEDSAKKKLIRSMKSEIEFLKTLLSDPNEMPLDKEEYREAIDEYIEKLEEMGVEVAKTDSTEDDKAFVQSIQNEKPEVEKAANAVKTAKSDDDFATAFPDLEAAIMASLKGSKDAAVAANDELDLSDIEIEDVEDDASGQDETSNFETEFGTLQSIGEISGREIFIGIEIPGLGKIPYYKSTGKGTGKESTGQIVPFLGFAQVFMQGYGTVLGYFVKIEKNNPKLKVNFDKIPGRVSGKKGALKDMDQSQLDLGDNSKAFNDIHKQLNNLQENVKPGAKKLSEKVEEAYGKKDYISKLMQILKILKLQTKLKNEGYLREDLVSSNYQLYLRDPIFLSSGVMLSVELQQEVSDEFSSLSPNAEQPVNDEVEQDSNDSSNNPIDKALEWVETDEAENLFADPSANALDIEDALTNLGLEIGPFSSIDSSDILGNSKEDVIAVLKQAKGSGDSQVEEPATEEGTAAAVEAIENEVPAEVENIQPADVEAAEEKLEPEIKEDPQKQANAEELKNKVENKKMAKSANVNYSGPFNGVVKKSNGDFEAVVVEAERRLGIYNKATDWSDSDLTKLHPSIEKKKDGLSDFEPWKKKAEDYMGKKVEEFKGKVNDLKTAKSANNEAATQEAEEDLQQTINDADEGNKALEAAINSDATVDTQTDGDSGTGPESTNPDQATIEKVLTNLGSNADAFPTLLANARFSQLLMLSINAASDAVSSDSGGTIDQEKLDSQNDEIPTPESDEALQEALSGIHLTEEEIKEPTPAGESDETKPAMSVEDATKLRDEIQKMQELFKTSDNGNIKNIDVMDLASKAFGEIPEAGVAPSAVPSVEEAKEEGQSAAQDDAELEDARYQDLYIGFKEQMDTFFSLDGKNDGFMDQFLLKYQGAKLAALIGNLDDIIRGDVPKDGEDNSGEARALSRATQQADNNLNEEQGQEISEKGQLELKTRLIAMLKGIKSLKAMMNSYKKNATRSSANPKLDGSALKKSLQRYMSNLQINIKAIVETCYIEHSKLTQTKSDDVDLSEPNSDKPTQPPADDTPPAAEPQQSAQNEQLYEAILEAIAPALEGVSLMEDAAREEKMALVNTTYDQMEQIYESSMQSALEKSQKETAMKNASQMMEFAKKEEFVALFPTFTGTFGGKPQTIDQATDAIDGLLRDFIETMKKVIVLAKGATIDETTLSKVIEDLWAMSLTMQDYFGVKSLLDDDMQAKVEKMLAQRKENQSLSDEPKTASERSGGGFIDKAKDLVGKGLEKLKQMFSWMSEETQEMLDTMQTPIPVFEPMIKAIDLTPKSDEWKNTAIQDVSQAAMWFNTLELSEQQALIIYGKNLIDNEAIVSEDSAGRNSFYGAMNSAGVKFQDGKGTRKAFQAAYKAVKKQNKEMAKAIDKLMTNHTDNLVKFFTFAISNPDLSTELFKVLEEIPDAKAPSPKLGSADESAPTSELIKQIQAAIKEAAPDSQDEGEILTASKAYVKFLIEKWMDETGAKAFKIPTELSEQETQGDARIQKIANNANFGNKDKESYDLLNNYNGLLTKLKDIFVNFMKDYSKKKRKEVELDLQDKKLEDKFTGALKTIQQDFPAERKSLMKNFAIISNNATQNKNLVDLIIASIYLSVEAHYQNDGQGSDAESLIGESQFKEAELFVQMFSQGMKSVLDNMGDESKLNSGFMDNAIQTYLGFAKRKYFTDKQKAIAQEVMNGFMDKDTATVNYEKFNSQFKEIIKSVVTKTLESLPPDLDDFDWSDPPSEPNSSAATPKSESFTPTLEESLRPIIEKMLNEHYNH